MTTSTSNQQAGQAHGATLNFPAMVATLVAVTMATLDVAITNTALPTIARDLEISDAASIWVIYAYNVMMVATLLPVAALGEVVGHRRVFVAGLLLFTATSLACGLASSLETLIVARALQGIGGAAISGVAPALIRFIYPPHQLGRGLGVYALVVGVAFTIGPTAASGILAVATWPWLFLAKVPLGVVAIALALQGLPPTERQERRFDGLAATLCAGTIAPLLLGLGEAAHGEAWFRVVGPLAVAALAGIALVRREKGRAAPILALDLFRLPVFALSSATSVCAFTTQGLAFTSLPFLFQSVLGYTQVETGFVITPWPAVVAIMGLIAAPMSDRYPTAVLGTLGLLTLGAGMASLALMPATISVTDLGVRLAVCGVGFGFFQSPNMKAIMSSAPPARSGSASGIVAVSRLFGQSLGAALVALCLSMWPQQGATLALWVGCGVALLGALLSGLRST